MSFMTPILTTSPEICACAAADSVSAAAMPARAASLMVSLLNASDAEIVVQFVDVLRQFRVADRIADPAILDDVMPVGDGRRKPEILLDQKDSEAFRLQGTDHRTDLLYDDRRQPLGRLVEQ